MLFSSVCLCFIQEDSVRLQLTPFQLMGTCSFLDFTVLSISFAISLAGLKEALKEKITSPSSST